MPKLSMLVSALARLPLWLGYAVSRRHCQNNESHARAAIAWLTKSASVVGGNGFSHSLHLARGWLPAYPETSGYILPSLHFASRRYGIAGVDDVVVKAWRWLLNSQREDGCFCGLDGKPQVFDTGQILIGANFMLRQEMPGASDLISRAGKWLLSQQEENGSFVAYAYHARPHAYYSRVGAALLDAGQLLDIPQLRYGGMRNLEWTLSQQSVDGWFKHMSFADHPPYSHTIVYTLEGLLAGYRLSGEQRILDAVVLCASKLRDAIKSHGGLIRSQYREGFIPVDDEICVTGLCQWSALCFRLARLGFFEFQSEAERSLEAAKLMQLNSPISKIDGALPGSVPFSGRYMRYAFPNWGAKFFLDALLESDFNDLPSLV